MKCTLYQEHASLRLYAELEADDEARLDQHLSQCAQCAAFSLQLDRGLGRLVGGKPKELRAGWKHQVAGHGVASGKHRYGVLAAVLAAGILLGMACSRVIWRLESSPEPMRVPGEVELASQERSSFTRKQAPVLAQGNSDFERLQVYLSR